MDNMILHRVLRHDNIAHVLGVQRNLHLESVLHRADGGDGVNGGADTAEALGIDPGILGGTPLEDGFNTAPHLGRRPGVGDGAAVDFHVDAQVPFDAGDGVESDASHGVTSGIIYKRVGSTKDTKGHEELNQMV